METGDGVMGTLAGGTDCNLPSRRGNQLNGNCIEQSDTADRLLPSRRGNQLNGNSPSDSAGCTTAATPLSQGKPIEWKRGLLKLVQLANTAFILPSRRGNQLNGN